MRGGWWRACGLRRRTPKTAMTDGEMFRPFTPDRWAAFEAATSKNPTTVEAFGRLLRTVSEARVLPAAMATLAPLDPEFEGRFFGRILPSLLRYARAISEGQAANIRLHRAGEPHVSQIERADAASWLAHLLLGTLKAGNNTFPTLSPELWSSPYGSEAAKLRCMLAFEAACSMEGARRRKSAFRCVRSCFLGSSCPHA